MHFTEIEPLGVGLAADVGGGQPDYRRFIADPELRIAYLNTAATFRQLPKLQHYLDDLVQEGFPLVYHPVNLNPVDPDDDPLEILQGTAAIAGYLNARWAGQDVAVWMWQGQYAGEFLFPVVFDEQAACEVGEKVRKLNRILPCPFVIENPPVAFTIESMHMLDFMALASREGDCGIVLDVGHLLIYQMATGRAMRDMPLDRFPFERVVEIHMAGLEHSTSGSYVTLIDSHPSPVDPLCWAFLEEHIDRLTGLKGLTLEQEFCPDELVAQHLQRAHRLVRETRVFDRVTA